MKNIVVLAAVLMSIFSFSSCRKVVGEGPVQTEDRIVNNFTGISTSISGKIYFKQSATYRVQLAAQQNILDVIETYRSGNVLIIKFRNDVNVRSHSDIVVNISAPSLESLNLSGSADVNVTGDLSSNDFNATLSGSGNLTIDSMKLTNQLSAAVSGSGFIKLFSGNAKTVNTAVSGSGYIDLSAVNADNGIAKISGSGTTKVKVQQTLDASISGSGDIYYFGNPTVTTHISGSGKVIKL
ncbi:head GIN domain-containing protein [Ferruginibacter sp.]